MANNFFSFLFAQSNLYFPPLAGNAWQTVSPTSLGWCQPPLDSLINYLEQKNTKALLILKDGKIVVEHYYGTFTADSLWYWASAGKSLTAALTGIAVQEGLLQLSDPVSQYLGAGWTSCTPAKEQLITIQHQLTMTTGLNDNLPATPKQSKPTRLYSRYLIHLQMKLKLVD